MAEADGYDNISVYWYATSIDDDMMRSGALGGGTRAKIDARRGGIRAGQQMCHTDDRLTFSGQKNVKWWHTQLF